jgi:hypothetical protein
VRTVLVIAAGTVPAIPEGCGLVTPGSAGDVVESLRGHAAGAVLVSDGLPASWLPLVEAAVRGARFPVIEVTSVGWDGITHSPLTSACRGVVAGFPLAPALREAVGALQRL